MGPGDAQRGSHPRYTAACRRRGALGTERPRGCPPGARAARGQFRTSSHARAWSGVRPLQPALPPARGNGSRGGHVASGAGRLQRSPDGGLAPPGWGHIPPLWPPPPRGARRRPRVSSAQDGPLTDAGTRNRPLAGDAEPGSLVDVLVHADAAATFPPSSPPRGRWPAARGGGHRPSGSAAAEFPAAGTSCQPSGQTEPLFPLWFSPGFPIRSSPVQQEREASSL